MNNSKTYIVGIGASAGGLDAIQQLFDHIPSNTGMAFVIVQHLSPNFKSLMPELLAKHTGMKIHTADNQQPIEPNCIYLNPKNKNIYLRGNHIYLSDRSPASDLNLPIDIFFHSLGRERRDRSIGVVLSGTGSDGSRGIKTIKEAGGTLFIQEPASAQFDGMPNSSIATNLADYILPPLKIAETLINIPHSRLEFSGNEIESISEDVVFHQIIDLIHKSTSIGFKQYKKNTLLRRLEKRMNINHFKKLYDYYVFLKSKPEEIQILKQDFLIGVTAFFRDAEAFEMLRTKVLPQLCNSYHSSNETLRVWVPGCSTGKEAYSIAMLIDSYIIANGLSVSFKIFATDIDEQALKKASTGIYTPNAVNDVSRELTESYFVKQAGNLRVTKHLRERIVFSTHNLLKDPPFIRMDLISCRNLLIYLEPVIQKQVLMNFQFSLNKNGVLMLGNSETLGHQSQFFKTISSKWKLYKNISDNHRITWHSFYHEPIQSLSMQPVSSAAKTKIDHRFKENPEYNYYKYLGQHFGPPMIFVDAGMNILFVNGNITSRLSVGQGIFQKNLLKMVNKEMASIIRSSIRKIEQQGRDVIVKNVVNTIGEEKLSFDLGFHKVENFDASGKVYVIYFSDTKPFNFEEALVQENTEYNEMGRHTLLELENALKESELQLQSMVEQLETSNEELQASNEELMASNEELQSTNEELQSVNEELYTVNAELQEKNKELSFLNNDVNNLLNSTEIGTLFLDVDLRIRKFTPAMQKHFKLQSDDLGRDISSFASNFNEDDRKSIIEDSRKTLQTQKIMEAEVCDENGHCFLRRTSPFITSDKKIEGVVIAFIDITALKHAEEKIVESEEKYRNLFENMTEGFAHAKTIVDEQGNPVDWEYITVNPAFEKLTTLKVNEVIGRRITEILPGIKDDPTNWIGLYGKTALSGKEQYIEAESKPLGIHFAVHTFQPRHGEWAATFWDITERIQAEKNLRKSENLFKSIFNNAGIGIATVSLSGFPMSVNPALEKFLQYSAREIATMKFADFTHPDDVEKDVAQYSKLMKGEINAYRMDKRYIAKNGHVVWGHITVTVVRNEYNKILYAVGLVKDITHQKTVEEKLNLENQFNDKLARTSPNGIYIYSFEKETNIYTNQGYSNILGYTKQEMKTWSKKDFAGHFHPDDFPTIRTHLNKMKHGTDTAQIEYRFKHKKGHWLWCYSIDTPFEKDSQGNVISFIGSLIDLSKKKETEMHLEKARKQAEAANIYKNQFLANMSHEIRTPMNGVVGFADLLDNDALSSDTRRKYIDIIKSSSNQLLRLIDDIIDISKIEAGEMKLDYRPCDIHHMLTMLEFSFNQINNSENKDKCVIKAIIPDDVSTLSIVTDPARLQQMLTNLIQNALKFANRGNIEFGYKLLSDENIQFYVKDEGPGIPKNKQKLIFKRFEQLQQNKQVKNDGTGLGLAITKGIVDLMNGKLTIESELNKGTTFSILLPLKIVEHQTKNRSPKAISQNLNQLTILAVDDEPMNIALFNALFAGSTHTLLSAGNGQEAVDQYQQHPEIDIVLMDIRMPVMGGVEAARKILELNPQAQIIAQTAYAMAGDKEKYKSLGFAEYISKPINRKELMKKIANLSGKLHHSKKV